MSSATYSPSYHLPRAECTILSEHHLLASLLRFLSRPAADILAVDLDYKLALAMQYACNTSGIIIPWDQIGAIMGPNITGSAVIQHLAKTRSRMVAKGLSVPPPLRRGGAGSRYSTAATPSSATAPANTLSNPTTATPNGPTTNTTGNKKANTRASKNSTKSKKAGKKASQYSDESDDDDEAWDEDDSDAEYGEPSMKRGKKNGKSLKKRKVKTEDSDEEAEVAIVAVKPKIKKPKSSSGELSDYGFTDINGVPIDESIYDDDNTNAMLGAGAPWLSLDIDQSRPSTENSQKKSLIVSLPTTPIKANTPVTNNETEEEVPGDELDSFVAADMHNVNQSFNVANPFEQSENYRGNMNNGFAQPQTYSAFGNDGGFGSNMGQAAAYPTFSNNGGFNSNMGQAVLYPIQTSWPNNNYGVASSSNYTSVHQTPAGTSAGAEYSMTNFEETEYNFEPSFDNSGYDFDGTGDLFNADNVDGNICDNDFFSGNYYGN